MLYRFVVIHVTSWWSTVTCIYSICSHFTYSWNWFTVKVCTGKMTRPWLAIQLEYGAGALAELIKNTSFYATTRSYWHAANTRSFISLINTVLALSLLSLGPPQRPISTFLTSSGDPLQELTFSHEFNCQSQVIYSPVMLSFINLTDFRIIWRESLNGGISLHWVDLLACQWGLSYLT